MRPTISVVASLMSTWWCNYNSLVYLFMLFDYWVCTLLTQYKGTVYRFWHMKNRLITIKNIEHKLPWYMKLKPYVFVIHLNTVREIEHKQYFEIILDLNIYIWVIFRGFNAFHALSPSILRFVAVHFTHILHEHVPHTPGTPFTDMDWL